MPRLSRLLIITSAMGILLAPAVSLGGVISGMAFWKGQQTLAITTAPQTIPVGVCSGVTTVKAKDAAGAFANVASPLTVNLTTTGSVTFYSDANCSTQITSVTIPSGSGSANFYFMTGTTTAETITAAAIAYAQAVQTETGQTNIYVWTGGGADANWSTGANWSGGTAPGASNQALFDGTCVTNCSPVINSNISVAGIRAASGFTGTITQNSGVTMTIGSSGWYHSTGTFAGGNSAITLNGPFALSGGTFTNTSGTFRVNASAFAVSNTPAYNHHNGKIEFSNASFPTIGGVENISFYDVDFLGNAGSAFTTLDGNMNVLGSLRFVDFGYLSALKGYGTINLSQNLEAQGFRWNVLGTILIKMVGTGTITGSTGSNVGALEINTAGTITLASTDAIDIGGDFTYTSGTVVTTNSHVRFVGTNPLTINAGSMNFNDVTFSHSATSADTIVGTLYVKGNLAFTATALWPSTDGGTIDVKGDISTSGNWGGGTTSLVLTGSGTQTMTRGPGLANFPGATITVNNASSVLTLGSDVALNTNQGIAVTAGSVNMAGHALTAKSLSLNSNTLTKNGGVLTVNGTVVGTGSLYGGTVNP